jgi:hypothetical protein
VSIFSTIFSVLLQIFYYNDDGTWPRIYNAVPFFAQTRAVFLLLVYNQVTDEVASAWAALFAVGLVCVLAAFAIDEDPLKLLHRLHGALHAALVRLRFEDWGSGGGRGGGRGRVRGRAGTGSSVSVRDVERDVVYMDVSLRGKQSRDRDRRASSRGHSSSSASDADGIELGSVGGGKGWRSLPDSAHTTASEHSAHSGASASLVRYEPTAPDVVAERDAALAYAAADRAAVPSLVPPADQDSAKARFDATRATRRAAAAAAAAINTRAPAAPAGTVESDPAIPPCAAAVTARSLAATKPRLATDLARLDEERFGAQISHSDTATHLQSLENLYYWSEKRQVTR